jgi:Fungal Zn(2)-Cys(6) binuclear cluster domain
MDSNGRDLERGSEISHRSSKPKARLSCQLCHQRKVKCDKLNPCSNCRRTGVTCVPVDRQRLPRGRNGIHKNTSSESESDLRDRLRRLEQLVESLSPGNDGHSSTARNAVPSTSFQHSPISSADHVLTQPLGSVTDAGFDHDESSSSEEVTTHDQGSTGGYLDSPFWENVVHEVGKPFEDLEDDYANSAF